MRIRDTQSEGPERSEHYFAVHTSESLWDTRKLQEMVRTGKQTPRKLSQSQGKTAVSQIYGPLFVARKGKLVVVMGLTVLCESDLHFDLIYHLY